MSKYLDELPEKTTLATSDLFVISDSADSNRNKKVTKATMSTYFSGLGAGDVSSNTSVSVDNEVVLFNGTTGKSIKRCTLSGIPKLTNGVISIAVANTDYLSPTGSAIAGVINAQTALTDTTFVDADYIPISQGGVSSLKKITWANTKKAIKTHCDSYFTAKNTAITGGTNTKITYDAKGLVTGGTSATTADIADSTNKRYVTDAEKTILSNTSGTNTGNEDYVSLGQTISSCDGMASILDNDIFPVCNNSDGYNVWQVNYTTLKDSIRTYIDNYASPVLTSTDIDSYTYFKNGRWKLVTCTTILDGVSTSVSGHLFSIESTSLNSYGMQFLSTSSNIYSRVVMRQGQDMYEKNSWRNIYFPTGMIRSNGIVNMPIPTYSNNVVTLDASASSIEYYVDGTRYNRSSVTLTIDLSSTTWRDSNTTATFTNNKLFYVYFKGTTGQLYWSDIKPVNNTPAGQYYVPVCSVFKNTTTEHYFIDLMFSNFNADPYYQDDLSLQVSSGGNITYPTIASPDSLQLTDLTFYSKDYKRTISTANLTKSLKFYLSAANTYTMYEDYSNTFPYASGSGQTIMWNNTSTYTLNILAQGSWCNQYIYLSNNVRADKSLIIIPGTTAYTSFDLALTEAKPDLSLSNLPKNLKLLYTFTYSNGGVSSRILGKIVDHRKQVCTNGLVQIPNVDIKSKVDFNTLAADVTFSGGSYITIFSFTLQPGSYLIQSDVNFTRTTTIAQTWQLELYNNTTSTILAIKKTYTPSVANVTAQLIITHMVNVFTATTFIIRGYTTTRDANSKAIGSSWNYSSRTITKLD